MAQLHYEITASSAQLQETIDNVQGQMKRLTDGMAQSGGEIDQVFKKIQTQAKMLAAGFSIKEFITKMTQVRSQFQAADTAMQTMLGSKAKADALMAQVRDFAKVSPLEFSDVTQATQMMIGFNIEAEKVPRFLSAIGDVSMGDTQKFNALTLAFSQMSATGKLMGQDLLQMINAGFNPLQQMSETTGKSIAELKDEMSKGAITAEQVQQAFIDATSEGGRFYNMSANASKTIQGQISMLDDAVDMAYNDIGEKLEGTITGAIQAATYLVENYQTVAKVVIALATAYGTYRAALLLTAAVEKSRKVIAADEQKQVAGINSRTAAIEAEIAKRRELIEVMKGERKKQDAQLLQSAPEADNRSAIAKAGDAEKDAKARLQAVNQEIEARYQAAQQAKAQADQSLQTAQADLAAKREALQTARQENELVQRGLTAAQSAKEAADQRVKSAREYLDTLKEAADYDGSGQGGSDDQQSAADEMAAAVKEQLAAANEVETATEHANTASKNLNTAATAEQAAVTRVQTATEAQSTAAATLHTAATARDAAATTASGAAVTGLTVRQRLQAIQTRLQTVATKAQTVANQLWQASIISVKNAWNAMKLAMMTNPIGAIITVVTTAISLFYAFSDSTDEATESEQRFGEEAAKTLGNLSTLYAVVNTAARGSQTYRQAMDELVGICEQYGIKLDKEKDLLGQVNDARQTLLYLIRQEGVERQHANSIENLQKNYDEQLQDIQNKIAGEIGSGSDMQDKAVAGMITSAIDARIDALKVLEEKETKAYQALMTNSDPKKSATLQKAYNNAVREYAAAIDGVTKETIKVANANGIHTKSADKVARAVRFQASQAVEAAKAHDAAVTAENQAHEANKRLAASTSNLTGKSQQLAMQIEAAKLTAEDFAKQLEYIKSNFNSVDLTLKLKLDSGEVPQWIKDQFGLGTNKPITQQQVNDAKYRASAKNQLVNQVKGKKGLHISYDGGKTYQYKTAQQIAQEAADSNIVASEVDSAFKAQTPAVKPKPSSGGSGNRRTGSGKTGRDNSANEAAEAAKRRAEEERRWQEQQDAERLKYQRQAQQTEIDQMADGSQKKLRQMQLDHQKALDEIDRESQEIRKANVEHARTLYEADPKNKKGDFYKSRQYAEADKLTADQEAYLADKRLSEQASYDRQVREQADTEAQAMRDYLRQWGDTYEQRAAIAADYARRIAKAETEGQRLALTKERDKAIADFDLEQFKKRINWEAVFGDLTRQATGALTASLQAVTADLERRQSQGTIDPKDIQTYQQAIDSIRRELETRDPFAAIKQSYRDIIQAQREWNDALAAQAQAQRQLQETQAALESARAAKDRADQYVANGQLTSDAPAYQVAVIELQEAQQAYARSLDAVTEASGRVMQATSRIAQGYKSFAAHLATITDTVSQAGEAGAQLADTFDTSLAKAIRDVTATLASLSKIAQSVVSLIGDVGAKAAQTAADAAKSATDTAQAAGKAAKDATGQAAKQTAQNASKALGWIGVGIEAVTALASVWKLLKGEDWLAKYTAEVKRLHTELAQLRFDIQLKAQERDTIFGTDSWGKAATAIALAKEKLGEWGDAQQALIDRNPWSRYAAQIQTVISKLSGASAGYKDLAQSIRDIDVKVQHATWFRSAKYKKLGELIPDAFNDDGTVNYDALQKFRETSEYYKKIPDAQREMIDRLLDNWKDYNSAVEQMNSYLSSTFGDLGQTISDALTEAFRSGSSAAQTMTESVTKMLEKLGQQMIYTATLQPLLDKAQKEITAILQSGGTSDSDKFAQISAALETLMSGVEGAAGDYEALMKQYQDAARRHGIDLWQPGSEQQSGDAKAWQGMSQDDASELNGRFTALQISGEAIQQQTAQLAQSVNAIVLFSQQSAQGADTLARLAAERNEIISDIARKQLPRLDELLTRIDRQTARL